MDKSKKMDAELGLGLVNYLQGNDKESLFHIKRAFKIDKERLELYVLYGALTLKQNDIYNAYELFGIAAKLEDDDMIRKEIIDRFFEVK